jgi:prolyl oligopeptidase
VDCLGEETKVLLFELRETKEVVSAKTDQHKLYFHKLGTAQKEDKVILAQTKKSMYVGGYVTEDDRYLVISAANSTYGNELY